MAERSIVLLTDFGLSDTYVGSMKGVIGSITDANVVDLNHNVSRFSVLNAQFHLYVSYSYFRKGSIFCVIVDPGVGSNRRALIAEYESYIFLLPDNGIISLFDSEMLKVYSIREEFMSGLSNTFQGRDLFSPIAAKLANGSAICEFAEQCESYVKTPFPLPSFAPEYVEFSILHIDHFGNAITSVKNSDLSELDCFVLLAGSSKFGCRFVASYAYLSEKEIGVIKGGSGFVEFSLNSASFAEFVSASIGDQMRLYYE